MPTDFFNRVIWGNPLGDYAEALAWFIAGLFSVWLLKQLVLVQLKRLAASTETLLDDFAVTALDRSAVPALFVGAFYAAAHSLILHPTTHRLIVITTTVSLTVLGIRFISDLIRFLLLETWARNHPAQAELHPRVQGVMPILSVFIWGIGTIFLLDNLGLKISTVVAGLGIGGVAVALAAQAVLGDLFAYVAILFDRPFVIGDVIAVGEFVGTVEQIGIKTTHLRSVNGEELIFANKDLTDSRLKNFRQMTQRRSVFLLGVAYETPKETLEQIPALLKEIIQSVPNTRFDRAHFKEFASSQLNFEVSYFITTGDYLVFMDAQQKINFAIKDAFDKRGIEFPYNTQTIHLRQPRSAGR